MTLTKETINMIDDEDFLKSVMIQIKEKPVALIKSIYANPHASTVTKILNSFIQTNPNSKNLVFALSLYPAFDWFLEKENYMYQRANGCCDRNIERLIKVQSSLADSLGFEPELKLASRSSFFTKAENLANEIKSTIDSLVYSPSPDAIKIHNTFSRFFIENDDELSFYSIKTYLLKGLELISETKFELFDELTKDLFEATVFDEAATYRAKMVCHNVDVLLKEYQGIVYGTKKSSDVAMWLVNCNSFGSYRLFEASDNKTVEAYNIIEFMKLVRGSIEKIKSFPVFGKESYEILIMLISEKCVSSSYKIQAKFLNMSSASYWQKKQIAILLLGFLLWGKEFDNLIGILLE